MTDIIHVPLNRLTLWDGNVRKTDINVGIDELAQSIKAHGLLQSLVVRKGRRGKFEIVAGQRRHLALKMLAESGDLAKDCAIPCALASEDLDPAEVSLAENVVRAPMHPADQFEAFRAIIDGGATVADVAARFGITEAVVTKRLKLGRLSPVKPLTFRQMFQLIMKPDRLLQRVEAIQNKERRFLARAEKTDKKQVSERLWLQYKGRIDTVRERQKGERFALVREREAHLRTVVTFKLAKESLIAERQPANDSPPSLPPVDAQSEPAAAFNTAVNTRSPTQMARVDQIRQQMEEWRKRHPGRDFGREM